MSFIDTSRLIAAANADAEFQLHARLWQARLELRADEHIVHLTIERGRVAAAERNEGGDEGAASGQMAEADVRISAPTADWEALLAAIPRPFFQDLRAACAHHGFRLDGERLHTAAFYPAIRRLIDLMREVHHVQH